MLRKSKVDRTWIIVFVFCGCSVASEPQLNSKYTKSHTLDNQFIDMVNDVTTVSTDSGDIGLSMTESDRLKISHSLETVESGVPTVWINKDTHIKYQIKPLKTYYYDRSPCRTYRIVVSVDGAEKTIMGKACRQEDGTWKVVSNNLD